MNTIEFPFQSFPELNTSRLLLRNLNSDDYEMMFFLRSDKTVNAFIRYIYIQYRFVFQISSQIRFDEFFVYFIGVGIDKFLSDCEAFVLSGLGHKPQKANSR